MTLEQCVEVQGGIRRWRALGHHVRNQPLGHDVEVTDLDPVSCAQFRHSLRLDTGIRPQ